MRGYGEDGDHVTELVILVHETAAVLEVVLDGGVIQGNPAGGISHQDIEDDLGNATALIPADAARFRRRQGREAVDGLADEPGVVPELPDQLLVLNGDLEGGVDLPGKVEAVGQDAGEVG